MWHVLTRRPSLLLELLQTLRQLLAAQQETNLLLRELLLQHGRSPSTPQLTLPQPLQSWTSSSTPTQKKVRTRNDVSTTMDLTPMNPAQDDQPSVEPEPPAA